MWAAGQQRHHSADEQDYTWELNEFKGMIGYIKTEDIWPDKEISDDGEKSFVRPIRVI